MVLLQGTTPSIPKVGVTVVAYHLHYFHLKVPALEAPKVTDTRLLMDVIDFISLFAALAPGAATAAAPQPAAAPAPAPAATFAVPATPAAAPGSEFAGVGNLGPPIVDPSPYIPVTLSNRGCTTIFNIINSRAEFSIFSALITVGLRVVRKIKDLRAE